MGKLTRVTGKVFASEAQAETGGIGQFGSAATGVPNPTTDVATIQALNAYKEGWGSAVISGRNFPPLEEVNGVLKNISYQTCYILQEGVPTYDSGTTYSNTSIVKTINEYGVLFYHSLQDDNTNHALSDTSWWERMYFQNGYEGDIAANRSLTLTGAVSGTVSFNLATAADNTLTLTTTGHSKTVNLTGAVTGSTTLNTGNGNSVSIATSINNLLVDGKWVAKRQQLFTNGAAGTYSANLRSYLGVGSDSTTQYEVLYQHEYYSGSTPSKYGFIYSDIIPSVEGIYTMFATDQGRTTAYLGVIPVKQYMYLSIKQSFSSSGICALAYRRLGTNS